MDFIVLVFCLVHIVISILRRSKNTVQDRMYPGYMYTPHHKNNDNQIPFSNPELPLAIDVIFLKVYKSCPIEMMILTVPGPFRGWLTW
jgi:hypothetical protein